MGFSKEWDRFYKNSSDLTLWPWSDLVSFVMRYAKPHGKQWKVLELGCGAGANIPFMKRLGVDYYAVDGSPFMIKRLQQRFPELKRKIMVGDFTKEIPFEQTFDLVFDRASLSHNTTSAIQECLSLVFDKLKSEGKFIGIHWFSTKNTDFRFKRGTLAGDSFTRTGFTTRPFAGVGNVHFSDKKHLRALFKDFQILALEHITITQKVPQSDHVYAAWNLVAEKKGKQLCKKKY